MNWQKKKQKKKKKKTQKNQQNEKKNKKKTNTITLRKKKGYLTIATLFKISVEKKISVIHYTQKTPVTLLLHNIIHTTYY